jgi:hypothetical protein
VPGDFRVAREISPSARAEIIRVATEQESDLVVMGVHGRRAVDLASLDP